MFDKDRKAFTLIELLVAISIISLLMGILIPALAAARSCGWAVVCKSNLRQLVLANLNYASQNNGSFVIAAKDIATTNLHRWHGVRDTVNDTFDPRRSDLTKYLEDGAVKKCPQKVRFVEGNPTSQDFEDGCGGYGYNMTYLGSKVWSNGFTADAYQTTAKDIEVLRPGETLMFTDTALARMNNDAAYYIQYSFAEARFWASGGQLHPDWGDPSPSIHFRHAGRVNIGWVDGHIDMKKLAPYESENIVYGDIDFLEMMLGWFEPFDNSLFDLK